MKIGSHLIVGAIFLVAILATPATTKAEPYPQIKAFKNVKSTGVDKANAWLKKKGDSIQILEYQCSGNVITILWIDKPYKIPKCSEAYPPAMQIAMKAAGKCYNPGEGVCDGQVAPAVLDECNKKCADTEGVYRSACIKKFSQKAKQ
jgi:hypothetical protein